MNDNNNNNNNNNNDNNNNNNKTLRPQASRCCKSQLEDCVS